MYSSLKHNPYYSTGDKNVTKLQLIYKKVIYYYVLIGWTQIKLKKAFKATNLLHGGN